MKSPESLLHERNPQLHTTGPVEFSADVARARDERVPNEPIAKLGKYLTNLERHSLFMEIPEDDPVMADRLLKAQKSQLDARVIKPEDVPNSFWETQKRAAREQGHGDIEITEEMKHSAVEVLQRDQRESLKDWVDYFTSGDATYPTWFKYYIYDAVTKLGDYNKDKGEFPKRSRSTTDPFPSLNREALSYVYDALLDRANGEQPEDETLQKIIGGANFAKLYAHALAEVGFADPELLKNTKGNWVKYEQTDDMKAVKKLSNSLKGYGTGWCTAGEGYARSQLADGDFYVYYSYDNAGKARVPRIAVRMEYEEVVEVRGIVGGGNNMGAAENVSQELEAEMIDIAMEKVKDLPGGEQYFKRAEDMKMLTAIDNKLKKNPEADLSREELRFIYEFDHEIEGFGYEKDPRIYKIRDNRNIFEDLNEIFDLKITKENASEALRSLLDMDEFGAFTATLRRLKGIDASIIDLLLEDDSFYEYAKQNTEWAMPLIPRGVGENHEAVGIFVYNFYEHFSGIGPSHVELLFKTSAVGQQACLAILERSSKEELSQIFTEEALESFMFYYLKGKETWRIADELHELSNVDPYTAKRLLLAGEDDLVYKNFKSFSRIAKSVIRRYKEDSDYNFEDLDAMNK